jgi:hypothetical protein
MSIRAVTTKPILHASIVLMASIAVHSQNALAQVYEPVCQVSTASGYCRAPSIPLTLEALPEPAPLTESANPLNLTTGDFGTFQRPFSMNSLWNIRPRFVTLGTAVIPQSTYFPMVGAGKYSTTAFLAKSTDSAVTVYPMAGARGVWDPDSEVNFPSITIPHWPADTLPASGSDGHADIVDVENGMIYSFWQLRQTNGRWTAAQYAWSKLDGRGWGDGSHYFQGARASGISSIAGLIRKDEINDGASQYYHALALSLTYSGMSGVEQYVFPATSGDRTWRENTGQIPTGALLMLPPTFDASKISNPDLRKIVNTLKTYGAYVVDRNVGTPFYIYVENGSGFNLHRNGWNSAVGNDLQKIRAALRQVTYAKDWVNAVGEPVSTLPPLNAISMRGPWRALTTGGAVPFYETRLQGVTFGKTDKAYRAESASDRSTSRVGWAKPVKGRMYEFKVKATNGGRAYLRFWGNGAEQFNTRALGDGETYRFNWPMVDGVSILGVVSGIGDQTFVQGTLTEVVQ